MEDTLNCVTPHCQPPLQKKLPIWGFSWYPPRNEKKNSEIHITDAIQSVINDNEQFIGHNFSGKYLDCGTLSGYINSTVEISKENKK